MKYGALYRLGADRLTAAGIEEAALDARLLLESVCHTDRNTLLVHGDTEVEQAQEQRGRAMCRCNILRACRSLWGFRLQSMNMC